MVVLVDGSEKPRNLARSARPGQGPPFRRAGIPVKGSAAWPKTTANSRAPRERTGAGPHSPGIGSPRADPQPRRGPLPRRPRTQGRHQRLLSQPSGLPHRSGRDRRGRRTALPPAQGALLREVVRGRSRAPGRPWVRARPGRDVAGPQGRRALPRRRVRVRLHAQLVARSRGLLPVPRRRRQQQPAHLRRLGGDRRSEGRPAGRGARQPHARRRDRTPRARDASTATQAAPAYGTGVPSPASAPIARPLPRWVRGPGAAAALGTVPPRATRRSARALRRCARVRAPTRPDHRPAPPFEPTKTPAGPGGRRALREGGLD